MDLVPDEVWACALRNCHSFVLHHTHCGVIRGKECDCIPLLVGSGFGIDNVRPTA